MQRERAARRLVRREIPPDDRRAVAHAAEALPARTDGA
jgi:hypothetical protein